MSGESYCPECGAVFTGLLHQCTPKIRLTDEEIEKAVDIGSKSKDTDEAQEIAKAQLKKVVEWAYMPCTEHRISDVVSLMRMDCPECWQALLEEIK